MGIRLLIGVVLVAWVVLNSLILSRYGKEFDPYPYIFLNLFLSMLASIQASTILMPVGELLAIQKEQLRLLAGLLEKKAQ